MSKSEILKQMLISKECDLDKIYFVTKASEDEIARGEYYEIAGIKMSSNLAKHAVIKDIKNDK